MSLVWQLFGVKGGPNPLVFLAPTLPSTRVHPQPRIRVPATSLDAACWCLPLPFAHPIPTACNALPPPPHSELLIAEVTSPWKPSLTPPLRTQVSHATDHTVLVCLFLSSPGCAKEDRELLEFWSLPSSSMNPQSLDMAGMATAFSKYRMSASLNE